MEQLTTKQENIKRASDLKDGEYINRNDVFRLIRRYIFWTGFVKDTDALDKSAENMLDKLAHLPCIQVKNGAIKEVNPSE